MTEIARLGIRVQSWAAGRSGYDLPVLPEAGLTAARMTAPTRLEPVIYAPLYCLVLQGRKTVHFNDRAIGFNAGEGAIISHYLPVVGRIEEASAARPYLALALMLDLDLLRELAAEAPLPAAPGAGEPILTGRASPELADAMARLFALADEPGPAAVLAPLLSREIHFRLLLSDHGAMLRRLTQADSHASRIARAIAHIRQTYAGPLSVPELARIAGMSPSSFHEHFRAITATTPLQFQKQLRLTEARRLLISGRENVGTAARSVGYESPTQFSREYARAFGRSPRNDLAAAA